MTQDRRHRMTIEYGDEILFDLALSPEEFTRQARFLIAAKLYDLGRLSSGQAARFCELDRVEFLLALRQVGVPVSNLKAEDAQSEIDYALNG